MIRVAVLEDAPAMGRVMVDSFLSAHRGQMPDAAWQQRLAAQERRRTDAQEVTSGDRAAQLAG
jgi:hypothetical protein